MKKYIISLVVLLTGGLVSCDRADIPTYSGDSYIHFTQDQEKAVYRFSFATLPGESEYTLKIPMTVIGTRPVEDLPYKIDVVTSGDNCTTLSADSYDIPQPVFHKGGFTDTLAVNLHKTAELDTQELKLVLTVQDNENYLMGPEANRLATIYVSNILSQPSWWDDEFEYAFLGSYSDEKYTAFIVATGVSDLSTLSNNEIIAYVREFIYYLRRMDAAGTPVYEADGVTKVLDSINYTNV